MEIVELETMASVLAGSRPSGPTLGEGGEEEELF